MERQISHAHAKNRLTAIVHDVEFMNGIAGNRAAGCEQAVL